MTAPRCEICCPNDQDRVVFAFRRSVGRTPTDAEASELLKLLRAQEAHFAQPAAKPAELVKAGVAATAPAKATLPEFAAWTVVARVLLNLDETITKR